MRNKQCTNNLCRKAPQRNPQRVVEQLERIQAKYGPLPVLFLAQTEGISKSLCNEFWSGKSCDNGYRKEFFAQEFPFSTGACLKRPSKHCEEVYFFRNCSNTTDFQKAARHCLTTNHHQKQQLSKNHSTSKASKGKLIQRQQDLKFTSLGMQSTSMPAEYPLVLLFSLLLWCALCKQLIRSKRRTRNGNEM